MKGVSPFTIGLILLAIPVFGWLWWTSGEDEAPVGAVSRSERPAGEQPVVPDAAVEPRQVPEVTAFSAMIDQPLFAATRSPQGLGSVEEMPVTEESALPPPPADNIGDRYRLIGTVQEEGRVTALLAGTNGTFVRVRRGDRLEDWTVGAINRQRVLMVHGETATELTLEPNRGP